MKAGLLLDPSACAARGHRARLPSLRDRFTPGFKGPGAGADATGAALTFGKRLSKDLYVTYERSLSGTLGTLYIFYDLSKRLRLRGQTGASTGLDLIYTVHYE